MSIRAFLKMRNNINYCYIIFNNIFVCSMYTTSPNYFMNVIAARKNFIQKKSRDTWKFLHMLHQLRGRKTRRVNRNSIVIYAWRNEGYGLTYEIAFVSKYFSCFVVQLQFSLQVWPRRIQLEGTDPDPNRFYGATWNFLVFFLNQMAIFCPATCIFHALKEIINFLM